MCRDSGRMEIIMKTANQIKYAMKCKNNRPIVFRCLSCGAPIRDGESYHELIVKGDHLRFCTFCVGLSEYIADMGDHE